MWEGKCSSSWEVRIGESCISLCLCLYDNDRDRMAMEFSRDFFFLAYSRGGNYFSFFHCTTDRVSNRKDKYQAKYNGGGILELSLSLERKGRFPPWAKLCPAKNNGVSRFWLVLD